MSTHIEIDVSTKKTIEKISDMLGISQKEVVSIGINMYGLSLMKRYLSKEDLENPMLALEFAEAKEWLKRMSKRKFKELVKKGEKA